MADIEVHFYDDLVYDSAEAVALPAAAHRESAGSIHEAESYAMLAVYGEMHRAAAVVIDDVLFIAFTTLPSGSIRRILTPAAGAYFDEHQPGWRIGLSWPLTTN
jgi:hypothetical protein